MAYALAQTLIATPIGIVRVTANGEALSAISIEAEGDATSLETPLLREAARQLAAYFAGGLTEFDLPVAPLKSARGAILRQAIGSIGYGETQSYGELARRFDSGPRAIGQACARNPFPIIVPCHRVIGSGGALGFYSGGKGVATKEWLIAHERANASRRR